MKKILILFLGLVNILGITGCKKKKDEYQIIIASKIENKREHTWVQPITTKVGNSTRTIYVTHHNYYFAFEEVDYYEFSVSSIIYSTYNEGDYYTLTISDTERNREKVNKYFFDSSVTYTKQLVTGGK